MVRNILYFADLLISLFALLMLLSLYRDPSIIESILIFTGTIIGFYCAIRWLIASSPVPFSKSVKEETEKS